MTAARKCSTQFGTVALASLGFFLASAAPTAAQPSAVKAPRNARPGDVAAPKKLAPDKPPPTPSVGAPTPVSAPRKFPPLPPLDTSLPPPSLPRAPREKMRACAEEWEKMKRATKTGLPMWRDFATGCLTR